MEIELKYGIDDQNIFLQIWNDTTFEVVEGTKKAKKFKTVYYDTDDFRLKEGKVALRIRDTGDDIIATLKTLITAEYNFHRREEIEVLINDIPQNIDIEIFEAKKIGLDLKKIIGTKKLIPFMHTEIERKMFHVKNGDSIIDVALDIGKVVTNTNEASISEMELELVSGPENGLLSLGKQFEGKYKLRPEVKTKYEKGLDLLGMIKGEN